MAVSFSQKKLVTEGQLWLDVCVSFSNIESVKNNKTMSSMQNGYLTPRKITRIVVLRGSDLSYGGIAREVGGNVATSEYESFVYIIREHNPYNENK